jgi:hypothetical protein
MLRAAPRIAEIPVGASLLLGLVIVCSFSCA